MIGQHSSPLHSYAVWLNQTSRNWPRAALGAAQRALIDTIACMVPGAEDSAPSKLWPVLSHWGEGVCVAAGQDRKTSPPNAALFNGTAAHALDFDDNFDPAKAHASAVLVPALLAIGDAENATIGDLLDGYICGLQIMGLVGQAVNPFHRSRGWHATGTLGTIGAAAGCARMLRLEESEAAAAISMATSMAGGFMSQFGSDTKPLHAGLAASGGVKAAYFAQSGITSGEHTFDGPTGLRQLMVGPDVEQLAGKMEGKEEHGQTMRFQTENIGEPLHILEHGLKVKRFPNCGSLHRSLDGLLALMEAHQFTPEEVDFILIRAPAAHLRNLMHENPQTPAEAKFSLEYSLATALVTGEVSLNDYLPAAISRPDIRASMPKIRKEYVEKMESEFPTEVHVHLKSVQSFDTAVAMPAGSKSAPMSDSQIWTKLETCLAAATQFEHTGQLLETLRQLDGNLPVRHLTNALGGRVSNATTA